MTFLGRKTSVKELTRHITIDTFSTTTTWLGKSWALGQNMITF